MHNRISLIVSLDRRHDFRRFRSRHTARLVQPWIALGGNLMEERQGEPTKKYHGRATDKITEIHWIVKKGLLFPETVSLSNPREKQPKSAESAKNLWPHDFQFSAPFFKT